MKLGLSGVCLFSFSLVFSTTLWAKPELFSFDITDQLAALDRVYSCPVQTEAFCRADYTLFLNPYKNHSHIDYTEFAYSSLFIEGQSVDSLPPLPVLRSKAAYEEGQRLQGLLKKSVPHAKTYSDRQNEQWIKLARKELEKSGILLKRAQIIIVVDRNPVVQSLCLVLAFPKNEGKWKVLGGDRVSTGKKGRKLYYVTPTGVFMNTTERVGYRALGTKNKLGIRGNGGKGMRVWDFGWQWAEKGWLPNHVKGQIRLEMHATDPVYLEPRLGHTASEGCVRISADMNRFIDHYGLIDMLYSQVASREKKFRAILSKTRQPTPIAGDLLIIVDSAEISG